MHTLIKTHILCRIGALFPLILLAAGCSSLYGWVNIHQSARGSVYLKEVADWSYEADHPATIDQATLLIAVQGVVAEDIQHSSVNLPAGGSKPMRVFSDEDAEFLAPLLAQGLSQAKPDQIVGFTVSSSAGSGAEPAAGTIYRSRGSLYLTVAPMKNRKVTGFMPSTAARVERAPAYTADWTPGTLAMVIDPRTLAKAQRADGAPAATEPLSQKPQQDIAQSVQSDKTLDELQQAREANRVKDSEIAVLRKEVEWMKQELQERSSNTNTVSKRLPPKKRSAEASPSR